MPGKAGGRALLREEGFFVFLIAPVLTGAVAARNRIRSRTYAAPHREPCLVPTPGRVSLKATSSHKANKRPWPPLGGETFGAGRAGETSRSAALTTREAGNQFTQRIFSRKEIVVPPRSYPVNGIIGTFLPNARGGITSAAGKAVLEFLWSRETLEAKSVRKKREQSPFFKGTIPFSSERSWPLRADPEGERTLSSAPDAIHGGPPTVPTSPGLPNR
jgi:hypothetical protein